MIGYYIAISAVVLIVVVAVDYLWKRYQRLPAAKQNFEYGDAAVRVFEVGLVVVGGILGLIAASGNIAKQATESGQVEHAEFLQQQRYPAYRDLIAQTRTQVADANSFLRYVKVEKSLPKGVTSYSLLAQFSNEYESVVKSCATLRILDPGGPVFSVLGQIQFNANTLRRWTVASLYHPTYAIQLSLLEAKTKAQLDLLSRQVLPYGAAELRDLSVRKSPDSSKKPAIMGAYVTSHGSRQPQEFVIVGIQLQNVVTVTFDGRAATLEGGNGNAIRVTSPRRLPVGLVKIAVTTESGTSRRFPYTVQPGEA